MNFPVAEHVTGEAVIAGRVLSGARLAGNAVLRRVVKKDDRVAVRVVTGSVQRWSHGHHCRERDKGARYDPTPAAETDSNHFCD
jgi:hypothetical protein